MSDLPIAIGPVRPLIETRRDAYNMILVMNGLVEGLNKTIVFQKENGISAPGPAFIIFAKKAKPLAQILLDFSGSRITDAAVATSAAREIVANLNAAWDESLRAISKFNVPSRTISQTPFSPDQNALDRIGLEANRLAVAVPDAGLVAADLVWFAEMFEELIDPWIGRFGLYGFGPFFREAIGRLCRYEEEGKRLLPEYSILNARSLGKLLGTICSLINVQPSEVNKIRIRSVEEFAGLIDAAVEKQISDNPKVSGKPITKRERQQKAVLELLRSLPSAEGLQAGEISSRMPKHLAVGESTLRRHILPPLIQSGEIQNTPGIGYHLPIIG